MEFGSARASTNRGDVCTCVIYVKEKESLINAESCLQLAFIVIGYWFVCARMAN
jgi:hypothetical protein